MLNELHPHLLKTILGKVGDAQELKSLRLVSKNFATVADEPELYSADEQALKRAFCDLRSAHATRNGALQQGLALPRATDALTRSVERAQAHYDDLRTLPAYLRALPVSVATMLRAYKRPLPLLNIGGQLGVSGKVDFIYAGQMTAPVMRGQDARGRPFLAIRLTESGAGHDSPPFVCNLHEQYKGRWNNLGGQSALLSGIGSAENSVLIYNGTLNRALLGALTHVLSEGTFTGVNRWGETSTLRLV